MLPYHDWMETRKISDIWSWTVGPSPHSLITYDSSLAAIQKQLSMMKNGEGGLSVFLGLTGTKEELGLKADNYWIFTENNFDELCVFLLLVSVEFT